MSKLFWALWAVALTMSAVGLWVLAVLQWRAWARCETQLQVRPVAEGVTLQGHAGLQADYLDDTWTTQAQAGDIVLVKNAAETTENGLYRVLEGRNQQLKLVPIAHMVYRSQGVVHVKHPDSTWLIQLEQRRDGQVVRNFVRPALALLGSKGYEPGAVIQADESSHTGVSWGLPNDFVSWPEEQSDIQAWSSLPTKTV